MKLTFCRASLKKYHNQLTLFIALFAILLVATPIYAIGPGTGGSKIRVDDERIGPYILLVATSPLPVTLDQQMSVWVRVTNDATNQLMRDSIVMVDITPREGGETLTAQATHENAGNDFDYVAHFDVDETGFWEVNIVVDDELGEVDVSFSEQVSRGANTTLLIGLGVPFIVLAFVIGVYFWRRSEEPA